MKFRRHGLPLPYGARLKLTVDRLMLFLLKK